MAFETVAGNAGGSLRPFSKFQEGETLEGYFLGMTPNKIDANKLDLNFKTATGQEVKVPRAGKLNYLEQDLEQNGGKLVVGAMTRLTCTGFYTAKGRSFQSPRYSLAQDLSNTIEVTEEAGANQEEIEARIAALKAGN